MRLHPSLRTSYTCWADAPPGEVRKRLKRALGRQLAGSVGRTSFTLTLPRDDGVAVVLLVGGLRAAGRGTVVEVSSPLGTHSSSRRRSGQVTTTVSPARAIHAIAPAAHSRRRRWLFTG